MKAVLVVLVVSCSIAVASWVCPVRDLRETEIEQFPGIQAPAVLQSLEVIIAPVPIEAEIMEGWAEWDYMVTETFIFPPEENREIVLACLDLGIVPEEKRDMIGITVDGDTVQPCSTLAGPLQQIEFDDITSCILRYDFYYDEIQYCMLEDMETYRQRFQDEEQFRSAVPQTARIYVMTWDLEVDSRLMEVTYLIRGWTYLTGGIPLQYSLLQPALWEGEVRDIRITLDLSGVEDMEDWSIVFDGEVHPAGETVEFQLVDYNPQSFGEVPVLKVVPAGLSEF